MINGVKIDFIAAAAGVVGVLALLISAIPARAADPIFPTGSRIGLVPPAGMVMSKNYPGFEDPDKDAAIIITTLPAKAYDEMEATAAPEVLNKQGLTMEKREPMQLAIGKAFLVIGHQAADKMNYRKWLLVAAVDDMTALVIVQVPDQDATYPDTVLRAALSTLAVRATVPDAERLALLPFAIGDLAGFQIEGVLPGRALMLADIPADPASDKAESTLNARLFIAASQGGPHETNDWANFARLSFDSIPGIKDVKYTMAEPLRINGQQGYQTMAKAKQMQGDTDIMVVQWLRFGAGGYMQMVGIARADIWTSALTRMRTVRDSIDPK
jgi:hypothetical protein